MKTAVIGMRKTGLPLAAQFADRGHEVVRVDVNTATDAKINAGQVPFPGEAQLDDYLDRLVPAERLRPTTDYADGVPGADAVVIVISLFLDAENKPDLGWMDSATHGLAANPTPGTLGSYETVLPVGTTRTRWEPMIEEISGLAEGSDFHLISSPERVLTGRGFEDLRKSPKLIGGLSEIGAAKARNFDEADLDFDETPELARPNGVCDLGSAEASEMVKLAETADRDVNIGLANQIAIFAEESGIDIHQVIDACNSQPSSRTHRLGISVGGRCITVHARLYLSNDPAATVVGATRAANAAMPRRVTARLAEEFGDLSEVRVAVLGADYRGEAKETAFSGVFDTVRHLRARGAVVTVHDPLYTHDELKSLDFEPHTLGEPADAAILHTDHTGYSELVAADPPDVQIIMDGRNVLGANHRLRLDAIRIVAIRRATMQ